MGYVRMAEDLYTVSDLYALPEGKRAEVIDGVLYNLAAPDTRHQLLLVGLLRKIADHIDEKKQSCKVIPAPFAVRLCKDDKTCVEPDLSIICEEDKLSERGCEGAPDWIIEILSPSSRHTDCYVKLFKYRSSGVREYWIVDPGQEGVRVYQFEKDTYEEYSFDEEVPAGICKDLKLTMRSLL